MQQFRIHISARYLITCLLLVALSSVALLGFASSPQKVHAAKTVNIMPLGNSITGSPGCWRALVKISSRVQDILILILSEH